MSGGRIPQRASATADQRGRDGLVLAGLCAASGAFVPAVARLTSVAGGGSPLVVSAATAILGAVLATPLMWSAGELPWLFDRRHAGRLLVLGILGTVAPFVLLYAGAARVSAIETALCLAAEPLFAFLGSWLVLGHRPTIRRTLALAGLVFGLSLALGVHGLEASIGLGLVLGAPLCWQLSHLMVLTRMPDTTPTLLTGARYLVGGTILGMVCIAAGLGGALRAALEDSWPLLAFQGMGLGYLGTLAWYGAITRLDLTRTTAIVVPSIPVLSLAASFLLLGEVATPRQWAGIILTVAGIVAFATAPDLGLADEPAPPGAV